MADIQENYSYSSSRNNGIMVILRKHLKCVTKIYNADQAGWHQKFDTFKTVDLNFKPELHRDLCDKGSVTLRNQGNAHFKASRYPEARLLYTQSIAAGVGGPLGSLAYSNRSSALFHMRLYKDCIKDIDRSLVLGYPNHQFEYNLHLRKAMCLQFLKKDHTEALNNALSAIEEHNKGDVDVLKEKVLAKMKDPEPVFNIDLPKPNKWKLPDLSYGPSAEVPCFSSAVSIKHTNELGRHLVANRSISTGDVLVVEECIVSAINEVVHWDFCSFCYKACVSLIPCKLCGLIMYCSVSCRESDWSKSHEHSCFFTRCCYQSAQDTVLDLNKTQLPNERAAGTFSGGLNVLLQRLVQFIGMDKIRSAAMNNEPMLSWSASNPKTRGFRDGKFTTVDLEALISLEDNFDKLADIEKENYAKIALMMSGLHKIPRSQVLPVSAIFLKLILVIYFNHKYLYAFKASYERLGLPRIALGDVLYLASSLINHACDASMYHVLYGSHIVFRARRPIKKGEQLTDCYVISAANAPYRERQNQCMEVHKFKCKCEACVKAWPMLNLMPKMSMLNKETAEIMQAAKFLPASKETIAKLLYFCQYNVAADKEMIGKMLALLREFHKAGSTMHQWYFQMQESIKNHYRTQGSCFFFKDAKEILKGTKPFDAQDAIDKVPERMKNLVECPGPFGLKTYI